MKIKQIILVSFIGLLAVFLILPGVAEARLVPCGPEIDIECEICHIFVMIYGIINFILFSIVPALAGLFIVFAGFKYYHAAVTNPQEAQKVKEIVIAVFIGLLILYGSLGFLVMFTEHIGYVPIYSHIQGVINECAVLPDYW